MTPPEISLRGVALALDGLAVLADFDLEIAAGEFVALVGPSGCGKSTLLDLLAGIRRPDRGSVRVGDAAAAAGRLALVPQREALLAGRTVLDNVAVGARLAGADRSDARRRAQAALVEVGLEGFDNHYPHALSGGMRQRVGLARLLVGEPSGWLLDEPLGALDALTRTVLQEQLETSWLRRRPTTVLVTHDLDEALLLADRVVVLAARPTRPVASVTVPLVRPRRIDRESDGTQVALLRAELLSALRAAGALA